MLYKNLPKAVGLRRITLHKSCPPRGPALASLPADPTARADPASPEPPGLGGAREVTYLLMVECTNFMEHIGEAANLLPILRGRICGYTGIYRVCSSF